MAKIKTAILEAHEAGAIVKTLFTLTGLPVQQQEVAAIMEVSLTKAHNVLKDAAAMKLVYDMESRKYQPSKLVPASAVSVKVPEVKVRKATPADDTRLGWLF